MLDTDIWGGFLGSNAPERIKKCRHLAAEAETLAAAANPRLLSRIKTAVERTRGRNGTRDAQDKRRCDAVLTDTTAAKVTAFLRSNNPKTESVHALNLIVLPP